VGKLDEFGSMQRSSKRKDREKRKGKTRSHLQS